MNARTLIRRSLRFHWRSHLGVVLGAAVGSAALIGALIVGDSVRGSLRENALQRLGWVSAAMDLGDRLVDRSFFDMPSMVQPGTNRPAAAAQKQSVSVLRMPGTMARQDGTARANQVNILGIPPRTFLLTRYSPYEHLPEDGVVLNSVLAAHLNARPGDEMVLRVQKPTALSRDVVLSPQSDLSVSLRLKVHAIAETEQLGNFSLQQNQVPPFNAFVGRAGLNRALGLDGKANLILAGAFEYSSTPRIARWLTGNRSAEGLLHFLLKLGIGRTRQIELADDETPRALNESFRSGSRLAFDAAGLDVSLRNDAVELRTSRIFLDEPVVRTTTSVSATLGRTSSIPVLTYLVNALRSGTNLTPYSMVAAVGPPYTPGDLKDDEVVINQWLADDQQLKVGSEIEMTYFLADSGAVLVERTNRFRVREVVPLGGPYADRTLMPDFPGIAKAESTHDWDAGFPLTHKIRPKDDAYWKEHRGTPKAFISLATGQRLWANRFGQLTAIRWPLAPDAVREQVRLNVQQTIAHDLKPADLGLSFQPVRQQALRAASQSQDFGGLFIGFSFFLIIAALILMALLFQFGLEQRVTEIGTLLALGFRARQVRRMFLLEGAALAFVGGVMGAVGGIVYAKLMLRGLTTIWRSATNTSALTFHASPLTLLVGLVSAVLVAVVTIWFVLRKQARQPARALLAGEWRAETREPDFNTAEKSETRGTRPSRIWPTLFSAKVLAWGGITCACILTGWALSSEEAANSGIFFGAGSLCLIAGLAFTSLFLGRMVGKESRKRLTNSSFSIRGAARRKNRSVATVALLASGVFLIVAIGAFRLEADQNAWRRSSGTGGFALIGESTLPIVKDLNTREGRDALGLDEKILQGVSFVPLRVREGDEASCLNLNRAQQPRLLGVDMQLLAGRFTFTKWIDVGGTSDPIRHAFKTSTGSGVVPAIGDAASIQWALHKKIGDTLPYRDERGNAFDVRLVGGLANSILQGSLIIDEAEFTRRFPGVSGYRMFLIDCPSNALPQVSAELSRALQDYGFEVTPAAERLAAFNAVQNTYLSTFQVLGGLGLLLGSAGLGIVVLRNVLERRGELALLIAVGFRKATVQRLVLVEHAALLILGLGIGIVAAAVAIVPALMSPRAGLPVKSLAVTLAGVLLFGLISTWVATRAAVKGNLLEGLRNE